MEFINLLWYLSKILTLVSHKKLPTHTEVNLHELYMIYYATFKEKNKNQHKVRKTAFTLQALFSCYKCLGQIYYSNQIFGNTLQENTLQENMLHSEINEPFQCDLKGQCDLKSSV